jgi:hypothetical protein
MNTEWNNRMEVTMIFATGFDAEMADEALPACIPDGLGGFTLDHLTRITGLADAISHLMRHAEDSAYALGSDLHDLHLAQAKGERT